MSAWLVTGALLSLLVVARAAAPPGHECAFASGDDYFDFSPLQGSTYLLQSGNLHFAIGKSSFRRTNK